MARHDQTAAYAPAEEPRNLLTINELATCLRITRASVYGLPIPYVLVGERRRYRWQDVEAYLQRGSP